MSKRRTFIGAEQDPEPPRALGPLFRFALREADAIRAQQEIRLAKEQALAEIADRIVRTEQHKRMESAKEALKVAKKKALDVPEVKQAADAVRLAKAAVEALPDAVTAKSVNREIVAIDESIRERRRSMVEALFKRKAPIPVGPPPDPLLPAGVPSGPGCEAHSPRSIDGCPACILRAEAAILAECPACGAKPGEACRDRKTGGAAPLGLYHEEREAAPIPTEPAS